MRKKFIIYSLIFTTLFLFVILALPVVGFEDLEIKCWPISCSIDIGRDSSLEIYTTHYPPGHSVCGGQYGYTSYVYEVRYAIGSHSYFYWCQYDEACSYTFADDFFKQPGNYTVKVDAIVKCRHFMGHEFSVYLSGYQTITVTKSSPEPPLPEGNLEILCSPLHCNMALEGGTLTVFTSNFPSCAPGYTRTFLSQGIFYKGVPLVQCPLSENCSYTFEQGFFSQADVYFITASANIMCTKGGGDNYSIPLSAVRSILVTEEGYWNPEGVEIPIAGFMCSLKENGPWKVCEELVVKERDIVYFRDNFDTGGEYSLPGQHHEIIGRIWKKNGEIFDAGSIKVSDPLYGDGKLHENSQTRAFYPITEITLVLLSGTQTIPKTHYILSAEGRKGLFYIKWLEKNPADY